MSEDTPDSDETAPTGGADAGDEQRPSAAITAWFQQNTLFLALIFSFVFLILPHVSPWEGVNDNLRIFQRFNRWMFGTIEDLFDNYGYYVVFFAVLLENSMFLGLLVPGAIILILAGLAAENGSINIAWVFALAISATWIGDTMSYCVGRMGWTRLLEKTGMAASLEKIRERMESHTTWIIIAYHFAGYSRLVGPAAAGLFRIPYRKWAPLDYFGGALWVFAFTMAGYLLGTAGVEFSDTKTVAQIVEWAIFILLVVAVLTIYARTARGDGDGDPPKGKGRPATVIVPVDDR